MAIEIKETFVVQAPIEEVWRFVMNPQSVVTCMPGAKLEEVVDERTFLGSVSVKVGAITASYNGKIAFTEVDEAAFSVAMTAEGSEPGGGTAKGAMSTRLRSFDSGQTEVTAEATVDLTGRIVQVGRGMIQGVSHQLFLQFVACAKERLEAPDGATDTSPEAEQEAISIVPLVLKTIWSGIAGFVRRLFGRPGA